MNNALKNKLDSFYQENKSAIDDLASYIGVPPMWLVSVFDRESGLDYTIVNGIGATGLNQLMPSTARGLGIDLTRYKNDIDYQLQSMKLMYKPIKGKVRRAGDLYMFNFLPASVTQNVNMDLALGEEGNYDRIWGLSKDSIYTNNKGLDYYKNGTITRGGVTDMFEERYDDVVSLPEAKKVIRDAKVKVVVEAERNKKLIIVGMVLLAASATIGVGVYIYVKRKKV